MLKKKDSFPTIDPVIPAAAAATFHCWVSLLRFVYKQGRLLLPIDKALCAAAALVFLLWFLRGTGQIRLRRGHLLTGLIMAAYLISCVVASFVWKKNMFYQNRVYLLDTFATLMIIYPLGHWMGRQRDQTPLKIWIHIQMLLWSAFMLYVLKTIFSYKMKPLPGGGYITMGNRLFGLRYNCNPNTSGLVQMLVFLILIILFFWDRMIPAKVLCIALAAIHFLALVLTRSRTSILVSVLGAAGMVFIWLSRGKNPGKKNRQERFIPAAAAVAVIILLLISEQVILHVYLAGKENRTRKNKVASEIQFEGYADAGPFAIMAQASEAADRKAKENKKEDLQDDIEEEASEENAGNRNASYYINRLLTGRLEIWSATFKALMTDPPQRLLTGTTPDRVFQAIYVASGEKHRKYTHNQFLEFALTLGIPSLIVYILFLAYTIRNMRGLNRMRPTDRIVRLVQMLFVMLVLANMTESTLLFYQFPSAYVFFFICGWMNEKRISEAKRLEAEKIRHSH